ncbi:MAG: DUF6050 family protein [Gracilibacteraceae bacterium]|jgi:hypothetical protein|nr:DUF6050 family protein [Gracilibacteraceae bacterium]
MTRREIAKDFFTKTVLPVAIAGFLIAILKPTFTHDGTTDYFSLWVVCGVPFGIRRMCVWLIPHNYDLGGTLGIWAINFIIGALIGSFIIIWRLARAAWYLILTVYRLLTYNSNSNRLAKNIVYSDTTEFEEK